MFQAVSTGSCPLHRQHREESGSLVFIPSTGCSHTLMITLISILHLFGLKNPSSLYRKDAPVSQSSFWPCNGLAPVVPSLLPWGAQIWTQHFRCSWGRAEQRGRTSPDLLATLFLAAQNTPGLFYCKSALLAHG